jgi:hypothetical protein
MVNKVKKPVIYPIACFYIRSTEMDRIHGLLIVQGKENFNHSSTET